jgi:hypothetical protein
MLTGERTSPEAFKARQARLKAKHGNQTGNGAGPDLAMVAKQWPTPAARDYKGANSADHLENDTGRLHLDQLPNFVEHIWSTPRSSDGTRPLERAGQPLPAQASQCSTTASESKGTSGGTNRKSSLRKEANAHWSTPTTKAHRKSAKAMRPHAEGGESSPPGIEQQAEATMWMTPRANEVGQYTRDNGDPDRQRPSLTGQAFSHQDPERSTAGETPSPERRSLNPLFVEWLMGWAPHWVRVSTSCGCSATALCRWKQHMRSALLSLASPSAAPPAQISLFE